jgi:aminoglycoside/choline kinase family phosphotransferase
MLDAEGNPYFIDFQGGRRGPIYYDLASFLWQASARYPQALREELIEVYRKSLEEVLKEVSGSRVQEFKGSNRASRWFKGFS